MAREESETREDAISEWVRVGIQLVAILLILGGVVAATQYLFDKPPYIFVPGMLLVAGVAIALNHAVAEWAKGNWGGARGA